MNKLLAATSFAAIMASGAASAATFTFDFDTATTGWQHSLNYLQDGVGLTVTGGTTNGGSAQVATWAGYGLGVRSGRHDQHAIDSVGPNDMAVLSFSEAVTITSLAFSYISHGSVFDFFVDGTQVINNARVVPSFSFTSEDLAQVFAVAADSRCRWFSCNSSFKLTSVTVETADPSVVPLPAAGWALLLGLGALGAVRRRKSV